MPPTHQTRKNLLAMSFIRFHRTGAKFDGLRAGCPLAFAQVIHHLSVHCSIGKNCRRLKGKLLFLPTNAKAGA